MLLSNTSKRLRKVVTSLPIPASHTEKPEGDDGPAETMDENMDLLIDTDANTTSCADLEHPAGLHIRTRAKRYQNSVRGPYVFY